MASCEDNIYYHPEVHGLVEVAKIDYSEGGYQFDYRVVWLHTESGVLYTGRDSGCSCPSPFEDFNGIADLERLNWQELEDELREEYDSNYRNVSPADIGEFKRAVKAAMESPR